MGTSNFGRAGVNNFGAGRDQLAAAWEWHGTRYGLGTRAPITSAARMGAANFGRGGINNRIGTGLNDHFVESGQPVESFSQCEPDESS